jgi:hypothetical protein
MFGNIVIHNLGNVCGDIQIFSDIGGITGLACFEFLIIPALSQARKNAHNLLSFLWFKLHAILDLATGVVCASISKQTRFAV